MLIYQVACVLSSGVWPDSWWARRRESARFEVTMQSAFQEKFSNTMTVRGLLGEELMMVCRKGAFAVANEVGRGVVLVAVAPTFANSYALLTWDRDEDVEAFPFV